MMQEWSDREPVAPMRPLTKWSVVIFGGLFMAANAYGMIAAVWTAGKMIVTFVF